jgi:predicted flap endonuclease-1-like 5' DNA nuclease
VAGKKGRGPLVRVELEPGRYVKMHREDARRAGLLPSKAQTPAGNKMRVPARDKAVSASANKSADFTTIAGVGTATAADLQEHGIQTLDQLRTADVGFLSSRAQSAIEEWRS